MTHIKYKLDVPGCLFCLTPKFDGEWCSNSSLCKHFYGTDKCKGFRWRHMEGEIDTSSFRFSDDPRDQGLTINGLFIPKDLITYLEIDGNVIEDYQKISVDTEAL